MVYQATTLALPKLFDDRMSEFAASAVGVGGLVTLVFVLGSTAQLAVGFMMDRLPLKPLFALLTVLQIPFLSFVLASALGRSGRFFLVASLLYFAGPQMATFIERHFNWLTIAFVILLVGGFLIIKTFLH